MRYLGLALYAEGVTDHDFLCPLLLCLCEDLCGRSRHEVEMHEVLSLNGRGRPAVAVEQGLARADRIFAFAEGTRAEWTVLFVHSDGSRVEDRVRAEQIRPALELIESAPSLAGKRGCAVVPVYEMEAWALADPAALRAISGKAGDGPLEGVPERAARVEKFDDPKTQLEKVLGSVRRPGTRRRKSRGDLLHLAELGRSVSLERLRRVPSFQRLEDEVVTAMKGLRILE